MKIFVTGAAGYVGSHCIRPLLDAGHSVVVFDNLSTGHREAVDDRASLVVGDLSDAALVDSTFAAGGFDAVMHFAASAEVGESVRHPLQYYKNNVVNTVTLLDAMREHSVKSLVFSSTCATYGEPPTTPITEDMPQLPINPYGRTKLAIEWAMRDCAAAWGLGCTALRYFNAAGASSDGRIGEDHDPESHLIPLVLRVALGLREDIKIFGTDYPTPDGTCIRDYIHVEDLGEVHRIAVESQQAGVFRFYNVGTGEGVSVQEVIQAARNVTGHAIPATVTPRRPGDPPRLFANASKIMGEFKWKPRYSQIERTIKTAWDWHRANPKGYAATK